jgi:hypothetical protein
MKHLATTMKQFFANLTTRLAKWRNTNMQTRSAQLSPCLEQNGKIGGRAKRRGFLSLLLLFALATGNAWAECSDLSTLSANSSYAKITTTKGWISTNSCVESFDRENGVKLNGKTSAKGVLTSPSLSDGCGTLTFSYGSSNDTKVGFVVSVTNADGEEVYNSGTSYSNKSITKDTVYSFSQQINCSGTFKITITNASPSSSRKNADRLNISKVCWTSYSSTPATTYTVLWNYNGQSYSEGTPSTSVAEGSKVSALPTTPGACSTDYPTFVGWSATQVGSTPTSTKPSDLFTTAADAPTVTGNVTYYAVFGNGTAGSGTVLWAENFAHFGGNTPSVAGTGSGTTIYGNATITYSQSVTSIKSYDEKLAGGTSPELLLSKSNTTWTISGIPTNGCAQMTLTFKSNKTTFGLSSTTTGITISGSETSWTISNTGNVSTFDLTLKNTGSANARIDDVSLVAAGTSSTAYISTCCTPTTTIGLAAGESAVNIGESGEVSVTFTPSVTSGSTSGTWAFATTGGTLSATTGSAPFTCKFTQAGTYTITANYNDGTSCPPAAVSQTVTVLAPVYLNIMDVSVSLGAVCGGTDSKTLTLKGYNLEAGKTIAITSGEAKVTVEPTSLTVDATGRVNETITVTYNATAAQSDEHGSATISANYNGGAATANLGISYATTGCDKETVVFIDRGAQHATIEDYASKTIAADAVADPTGVCTTPVAYEFVGWSETQATAATSTKPTLVSFPYTIPAGGKTLYAVYRLPSEGSTGEPTKVGLNGIVDGGKYYITASNSGKEYILKAKKFSAGGGTAETFDKTTVTEADAWTFTQYGSATVYPNRWIIKDNSGNYLYASNTNNGLTCGTTEDSFTAETTTTTFVKLKENTNSRIISLYNTENWRSYTSASGVQDIQLYSTTSYSYTTSPICGPYLQITGGRDVYVTSGNTTRKEVQVQDTIYYRAGSLKANASGSAPYVYVNKTAEYIHNVADNTYNSGVKVTHTPTSSSSSDGEYTLTGYFVVTYTPSAANVNELVRIVPRVAYNTTASLDSATVHARSLPEKFVIAAKNGDKWYALPADMNSNSGTYPANGYLQVNDDANPTSATVAPCNTIYTFDGMKQGGDLRYVRFIGLNGRYLWASSSDTGIKNDATDPTADSSNYNWLLRTTDNVDYTFGNAATERTLALSTNASTLNRYGMYTSTCVNTLRILPVADTCAYNVAPTNLREVSKKSTEVTIAWNAVAGADAYQYSLDSLSWTNCGAATQCTVTGQTANATIKIYVRAKHGSATNICSDAASISVTMPACDEVPVFDDIIGTISGTCGALSLSDYIPDITSGDACPVTEQGIQYSSAADFSVNPVNIKLTDEQITAGEADEFVTIGEPGKYYFRAYAVNSVGTGYSAQFATATVTSLAGLKLMFENDNNVAPLVAGKASKRVVYYSESPAEVTWDVKFQDGTTGTGKIDEQGNFTATAMGVYTITATQPSNDDYCAGSATTTIEVRNARYHSLITNCAKLKNGNIEVVNQDSAFMDIVVDNAETVKVTIVRDNSGQSTGTGTGNVAKDLFFSKYYESISNLKLIAIYNGTNKDIDISNVRIGVGSADESGVTSEYNDKGKLMPGVSLVDTTSTSMCIKLWKIGIPDNKIKAGQEIVLYTFGGTAPNSVGTDCSNQVDNEMLPTIDNVLRQTTGSGIVREGWYNLESEGQNLDETLDDKTLKSVVGAGYLQWSGRQAIALWRGEEMIDIIGSYHKNGVNYKYYAGDSIRKSGVTLGDAAGWVARGLAYDLATNSVSTKDTILSTNRNLLIRLNTVVDGLTAVKDNYDGDFVTLGKEWAGMQLGKNTANDANRCLATSYFSAIAGFDYATYFNRYEELGGGEVGNDEAFAKLQEDGTYRIDAADLNLKSWRDLSCQNIKIQGLGKDQDGNDITISELDYKVPIIVKHNANTNDEELFGFSGKGRATCPTCDVVIRDNAELTVVPKGYNELRDVYVYHTGRLRIPEGKSYNVRHVYITSRNNEVGYALVQGTLSATQGVGHYKSIDAMAWYDFSLPYNCKWKDITRSNGLQILGKYTEDWWIKRYDGQKRAISGTPNGATPTNWELVDSTETLQAGVGYIIGIGGKHEETPRKAQYLVRITLPNVSGQYYTETGVSDQVRNVYGYTGAKAEELPCHRGWNYIGNPFISMFDGSKQNPEWDTQLLLSGYYKDMTDGETYTLQDNIYVSVDQGTNGATNWVQTTATEADLLPFRAFFVQAVSDGQVGFVKQARALPTNASGNAPALPNPNDPSQFSLFISSASNGSSKTTVTIGDYTPQYEVGYDMLRMINKSQYYPQLYTVDSVGYYMIYQAIDRTTPVEQSIALGYYTRSKGTFTISLGSMQNMDRYDAVLLIDNEEHTTTDLLLGNYTFTSAAGDVANRFSIRLRKSNVSTDIEAQEGREPVIYRMGESIVIDQLPAGATVRVIDAVGRVLHQQQATGEVLQFSAPVRGAYIIQVMSESQSYSIKTIL